MTRIAPTILFLLASPLLAGNGDDTSYGYLRTVEGPGRVIQGASGTGVEIEANYPVLAGDLLELDPGGRLELSLPDFNIVRLAGGSELLLAQLALSADTEDTATVLQLRRGELQILVQDLLPVTERPRVDTANATVYLQNTGVYRIASDGYGWTEVVVREGFAEVATEAGSSVVRGGEQAWIEGERWPRVAVERAGGSDELERWGARLDDQLAGGGTVEVEPHLSYAAVPLRSHGSWVWVDGYRAWRPRVAYSWRPYESGWWRETPAGFVWVSHEPWAWVTYHYGTWVPTPAFGWVWRPGRRFAPAWVYWYWGPRWVGWVPVGYYSRAYGRWGPGFRFGIHGWAGGSWGLFADWTFCSTRDYRRRDLHRHLHHGRHLASAHRGRPLERGLVATDSRPAARRAVLTRSTAAGGRGALPDVTPFVARQRELPPAVSERVFDERGAGDRRRAVRRDELRQAPAPGTRPQARRQAVPGGQPAPRPDAWRQDSRRLRSLPAPGAQRARPRTAAPGARATSPAPRAGERVAPAVPQRPAPRGVAPAPRPFPGTRGTATDRSSVARRVWEGIRDRQRAPAPARPGSTRSSEGARRAAPPAARDRGGQPAPPSASRRTAPPRRAPSADRAPAPSRRAPSASRRSEPPRRDTSASGAPRGSSRSQAHSSDSRPPSRASSNRSSGRSARRRPPGP